MDAVTPADEAEAAAVIARAARDGAPLRIRGGGTRSGLGRPADHARTLETKRLSGITLHEPAELVISARSGTPVSDVKAELAKVGQILPFEPVDLRPLYGTAGEPTVGGLVAGNWSGPRRIQAGATRDHLIGVRFVNGRGEIVKSGGRVMKNVTGLDLVKLQCGAHGTLGLLTEVTFKVLPRAEATVTLAFDNLDDDRAVALLTTALGSPFEVSAAAHLPAGLDGAGARTLIRLEGFTASIAYRADRLGDGLRSFGIADRLDGEPAARLWAAVRDGQVLAEPRDRAVWRLSVPPARGAVVVSKLDRNEQSAHFYDWGGGLIWLAVPSNGDAGASAIRAALEPFGGHATLMRSPDDVRRRVPVFEPRPSALAALERRVRNSVDPDRILNRGLMVADA